MRTKYFRWVTADPKSRAGRDRCQAAPLDEQVAPAQMKDDYVCDDSWQTQPPPMPAIDLPLHSREQAVFLLHAVAEIEHALMVQYLYAAYSLRIPPDTIPANLQITIDGQTRALTKNDLIRWRDVLIQIAREEMAHLATAQNLLRLLGGPLNFEREDSPYFSSLYPFRFKLERLSLGALAKYVTAERPIVFAQHSDKPLIRRIDCEAFQANDRVRVIQVGGIFKDLREVFTDKLELKDFHTDTAEYQAHFDDWGYQPWQPDLHGEPSIVRTFRGPDPRASAVEAIDAIAEQGEGFDVGALGPESHFERFLGLYKEFASVHKSLSDIGSDWEPTWAVATNPNTTGPRKPARKRTCPVSYSLENDDRLGLRSGRIVNKQANAWARLFNMRYRMLLNYLQHFLLQTDGRYEDSGDRTPRGLLLLWTFDEMRRLKKIAGKLVTLPQDDPAEKARAGPPFELPYTLNLPDRDNDRWRVHFDVSRRCSKLIRDELLYSGSPDEEDLFLKDLLELDFAVQQAAHAFTCGQQPPDRTVKFQKVARILEEAVRGFDIGRHGNFWHCLTRDEFVNLPVEKAPIIDPGFDPEQSALVKRLTGDGIPRMPKGRPPVSAERIRFIRDWIAAGCPDNDPPGEVGLRREGLVCPDDRPNRPTSFALHIRPLMRDIDIEHMKQFGNFDLSKLDDVKNQSQKILDRLRGNGPLMPPANDGGPWPEEWIRLFERWIKEDHPN